MALLEVKEVGKLFGTLRALDGVNVSVKENTFHGLIGPNGSGKSTLLKAIAGDHYPDEGIITFDGNDITKRSPEFRAQNGLNLKFQITAIFPELSIYVNILLSIQSSNLFGASSHQKAVSLSIIKLWRPWNALIWLIERNS